MSLRRPLVQLLGTVVVLAGCGSSTAPDALSPDPTLNLNSAYAVWTAFHPSSYRFQMDTQGSWMPSPGFIEIEVSGGRVTAAHNTHTGAPVQIEYLLTIDGLWSRLLSARAQGTSLSDLRFSRQGVPVEAMVGSFADDSGIRYQVRSFSLGR
jgi:hypothetical protein